MQEADKTYTNFIPVTPMLEEARKLGLEKFSLEEVIALLSRSKFADMNRRELANIGEYTNTDRVYVFMNHLNDDGKTMLFSHIYEWCREGIEPQIDNPDLQCVPYETSNPRWYQELSQGRTIKGAVSTFPDTERESLEPQGIKTLLVVPILSEGFFWGFIGLDAVHEAREWTRAEEGLLRSIATVFGMNVSQAIMEQRLRDAEIVFQQFVDMLPMGVLLLDADFTFLYRNQTFRQFYGWDNETVKTAKDWFDLAYDPAFSETAMDEFKKCLNAVQGAGGHYTNPVPFPVRAQDGTERMTEFRLLRLGGDRLAILLTDVSDRLKLERMQADMAEQKRRSQKQQVSSLEHMAGSIAHVFNNQLSVIMGSLDMLRQVVKDKPEALEDFRLALDATKRASEVSSSMLTYLGKGLLPSEVVDLVPICNECLENCRYLLSDRVELEARIPKDPLYVSINPEQMTTILRNLVQNAQESMTTGILRVELTIRTRSDFKEKPNLMPVDWAPTTERYIELSVTDNGLGIPRDHFYRVFEPFFTTKFQGRGMGLSTACGYIRAWQGAIGVESELGKGSIFTIYLPIVKPKPQNAATL